MKKFAVLAIIALFSSITHGAQFIVVECWSFPNKYAYFSDLATGTLKTANSCGEALAQVPPSFFFLSNTGGGRGNGGVKYLFSDTPARG